MGTAPRCHTIPAILYLTVRTLMLCPLAGEYHTPLLRVSSRPVTPVEGDHFHASVSVTLHCFECSIHSSHLLRAINSTLACLSHPTASSVPCVLMTHLVTTHPPLSRVFNPWMESRDVLATLSRCSVQIQAVAREQLLVSHSHTTASSVRVRNRGCYRRSRLLTPLPPSLQ